MPEIFAVIARALQLLSAYCPANSLLAKVDSQDLEPLLSSDTTHNFQTSPSFSVLLWKILSILFGIIVLALVAMWIFRKFSLGSFQNSNGQSNIKILERRAISPKSMLYLVEIGGQKLLISESQLEVRPISDLDWLKNTNQGL